MPGAKGNIQKTEQEDESKRELYSHDDYVDLVLDSGRPLTHEYEGGSIEEDPRMLAFFDTLIQREHGGWNSESDSNYSEEDFYSNYLARSSDSSGDDSVRRSTQRVRDLLAQESRDSDESDDTAQAVLRRVRRLRRAAFLRRLVRGAERQLEDGDENQEHPSDSQNAFLRHLTREIMREALETSSDSSDSEPTVTLALPEELQNENNEENEPVQFNRPRAHHRRQYRRRSSSHGSHSSDLNPNPSSPLEHINNNEMDSPVRNNQRKRELSSSSSEEDSHEDECRINYLHSKRTKRRKRLDESDSEQNNDEIINDTINEPSTSSFRNPSNENQTLEKCPHSNTDISTFTNECHSQGHKHSSDGISCQRLSTENSNVDVSLNEELTGYRTVVIQDMHDNVFNHNGHKVDGHNNHNTKAHNSSEDNATTLEKSKKI